MSDVTRWFIFPGGSSVNWDSSIHGKELKEEELDETEQVGLHVAELTGRTFSCNVASFCNYTVSIPGDLGAREIEICLRKLHELICEIDPTT